MVSNRFADNQLVRHKVTGKTGRIVEALIDNGPHAAGVVFYRVALGGKVEYIEPRDLEPVRAEKT